MSSDYPGDARTRSIYSMMDFITELKDKFEIDGDFDFSILVEKNPIKKMYTYLTKVLAIVLKQGDKKWIIHHPQLVENDVELLEVKTSARRIMGTRKNPFWLCGNSKIQTYKDNQFIEYVFINPSKKDLDFVAKIRKKFNIVEPHIYETKKIVVDDSILDELDLD
jgi:hypothetical protein